MVITLIVGNGFDIGLGMKTKYTDFIDMCYLKKERQPGTALWRLKEHLVKDKEEAGKDWWKRNWADAEKEFGRLDVPVLGEQSTVADFEECLADFKNEFQLFLKKQNDAIRIPNDKVMELYQNMGNCVFGIGERLRSKYKKSFFRRIAQGGVVDVNVITYNYTDVLDRLLLKREDYKPGNGIVCKLPSGNEIPYRFNEVLHVHGNFATEIIFGVDDKAQIINEKVRDACLRKNYFIKKIVDDFLGNENESRARDMIQGSSCVITLGLSFGETDRSWWELLFNRASTGNLLLVPCIYRNKANDDVQPEKTKLYADEFYKMFRCVEEANEDRFPPAEIVKLAYMVMPSESKDPEGNRVWCDPFNLGWMGRMIGVKDVMKDLNLGDGYDDEEEK